MYASGLMWGCANRGQSGFRVTWPEVRFVNYMCIHIAQFLRQFYLTFIVISETATRELAHSKGCGPFQRENRRIQVG